MATAFSGSISRRPLLPPAVEAFWPILLAWTEAHRDTPNRGPHRHFLPMPFVPPCFTPEFFFDEMILRIIREAMGDRVVADQWGCDAPLRGSIHQGPHADYQHPLFAETPDMELPIYMLVVSFGLLPVNSAQRSHRNCAGYSPLTSQGSASERSKLLKLQCSLSSWRSGTS